MQLSLGKAHLAEYVSTQLNHFFPDNRGTADIGPGIDQTLERVRRCFSAVNNRYFRGESGEPLFNHLNADHYAMFLYFLSRTLYENQVDVQLCEKLFCLNKALHGIDAFYEVKLPDIFLFVHPVGTVLGRAQYQDFFMVYQNCTIGSNHNDYPILGKYVVLYKGSSVLGRCHIGNNSKISADSLVMDSDVQPDSIYIGSPRDHVIRENKQRASIWDPQ